MDMWKDWTGWSRCVLSAGCRLESPGNFPEDGDGIGVGEPRAPVLFNTPGNSNLQPVLRTTDLEVKSSACGVAQTWVQILTCPSPHSRTWDSLLNLSEPIEHPSLKWRQHAGYDFSVYHDSLEPHCLVLAFISLYDHGKITWSQCLSFPVYKMGS